MRAVTGDERLNDFLTAQYRRLGVLRSYATVVGTEATLKEQGISYTKQVGMNLAFGGGETEVETFEYHSAEEDARRWVVQSRTRKGRNLLFLMTLWDRAPSSLAIAEYTIARRIEIEAGLGWLTTTFRCHKCGTQRHVLDCLEEPTPRSVTRALQILAGARSLLRLLAYAYVEDATGAWTWRERRFTQANLSCDPASICRTQDAQAGWADLLTIPPNVRYTELFVAAVREARAAGLGMWAGQAACVDINRADIPALTRIVHIDTERAQQIVVLPLQVSAGCAQDATVQER